MLGVKPWAMVGYNICDSRAAPESGVEISLAMTGKAHNSVWHWATGQERKRHHTNLAAQTLTAKRGGPA